MHMRTARCAGTLIPLVLAMAPSVVNAQNTTSPTGGLDPAKLQLFLNAPPPTIRWTGPPASIDFWSPPHTGSDVPQWTIEWKALVKGPRHSAFSAGFFSQRGEPMPPWFQGAAWSSAATLSMPGPGMYRDQAGVTLGIQSPALTIKGAEVSAFADVFLPVSNYCPRDPVLRVLSSPAIRAGIKTVF